MAAGMWMGQRGYEQWVPAPSTGADFSPVGWQSQSQYLNGGAGVRSSYASHKEYSMSWRNSRTALRPIMDMTSGMYGTGLIYFIDPMAADQNVLPEHWAYPAQAAKDGPVLLGSARPSTVTTPNNTLGYPIDSVQYPLTGTSKAIYIPIPPGFTAWVGAHGPIANSGGVRVRPTVGNTYGSPVYPVVLSVTDTTRVNTPFAYAANCTGIELDLAVSPAGLLYPGSTTFPSSATYPGGDGSTATTAILSGLIVQILPTGTTPAMGGFISGQGHSGCKFASKPTQTPYSTEYDRVGMTAKLIEVGDWV